LIYEWMLDGHVRNFGDALYEIFLDKKTIKTWQEDKNNMHFPIGSVIDNTVIQESLDLGYKPIFYNCGWRGEELKEDLIKHCTFYGVRGPKTQKELARLGVNVSVSLDPAYGIPAVVPEGYANGLTLSIKHIKDPSEYSPNTAGNLGVDALFTPVVEDKQDILDLIEKISGARFVLAGAMHAAIIAHAYKVPFALLDTGFIDCPPKWEDWLLSVGVTQIEWVDNIIDGRKWYKDAVEEAG
jgi:hypothetical protein